MKKLFLIILVMVFAFLFLTKCDITNENLAHRGSSHSNFFKDNPFIEVGVKHNQGLEFVQKQIKKTISVEQKTISRKQVYSSKDLEGLLSMVKDASNKFLRREKIQSAEVNNIVDVLGNEHSIVSLNKIMDDSTWNQNLSPVESGLVKRILNLYNTIEDTLVLGDSLDKIDAEATNLLDEYHAKAIMVISAIAYESKVYWNKNLDEWIETLKEYFNNNRNMAKIAGLKQIGAEDVRGATVGAGVALQTGCAELTLGECLLDTVVAGALIASAAEAVVELYNWLFG